MSVPRRPIGLLTALLLLLTLAGCAQVVAGDGRAGLLPVAADAQLDIVGDAHTPMDVLAANALSDVQAFWATNYPLVAGGRRFEPLRGGIFSVDPSALTPADQREACLVKAPTSAQDNAFFCRLDDAVVYSRTGFIPQLADQYGDLTVALIFAHEFGHAIQSRLAIDPDKLIVLETQADCFAGAFAQSVLAGRAPHFRVSKEQLDNTLVGYLQLKDPEGLSSADAGTHGNGFDRLSAVATGINGGAHACLDNWPARQFTERAYATEQDYDRSGNQPIDEVLDPADPTQPGSTGGGLQPDLNAFWKQAAASIGKPWRDVTFSVVDRITCGASDGAGEFAYCPADNSVHITMDVATKAYGAGDFALGAVIAYGWGMAVRQQLFGRPLDSPAALLAAACYTGAYAANINTDQPPREFSLSPPDMDEATVATLRMVGSTLVFGPRGTTGLDRVTYFNKGYFNGLGAC